jgi:MYXO-CTERM domain-containing protein
MPRHSLLLPASLLLSCAPAELDSGAAAPAAAPEAPPAGASPTWLQTAKTRIAASARSIVPENGAFVAALPAHRAVARFTDEGLVLGEPTAVEPLELRFTSWGAAGAERSVEPVSPALGACLTELLPEGDCARQLEYAHAGVTAWWVGLDHGVEFGWTVAAPPAEGGDELVFEVEVSGADWLAAAGDGAELVDAAGESWTVSGALAWGADGAALPAWLAVEGDALVVRVEAAGAVYPVTVDPVLSAATTTLTGGAANDSFGWSVSAAGDVNGDGYDDVIIGAPYFDNGSLVDVGAAYIHHGSSSGASSIAGHTLTGGAASDYFGWSVSSAGDVNGDSYDDVIVGAFGYNSGSLTDAGAAYIHHGSSIGVSSSPSRTLTGGAANDQFGYSVASAGDVNGDGYEDVIIGAFRYDSGSLGDAGAAYIHHGSSSGVASSPSLRLTGGAASDQFGYSVAGAGDVNNDGYDDVIVGAIGYDRGSLSGVGQATIHHGSSSGLSFSANTTIAGSQEREYLGACVDGAGDVNGDGYDDVVIGAYRYDSGALTDVGAAFIHHGSSSGVSASASRTLTGSAAYDFFGESVSGAGDVDGDGYDDVVIGATDFDSGALSSAGAAHIHHGSSTGVSFSPGRTLTGGAAADYFGASVSSAGDVNGDGFDDVLVGAIGYDSGLHGNSGAATVHHGCTDGDGDGVYIGGDSSTPQDCDDTDPSVGAPSTRYVDSDGDGFGSTATVTACPGDAGTSAMATDCDDARADVNPAAAELCDDANTDEDCDGLADDADPSADPSGFSTFYADSDGDGFGDAASPTSTCDQPAAHVSAGTDCDDARADVNPAATDTPDDGVDQDCDGADATDGGTDGTDGGTDGANDATADGGGSGKSGCSTTPASPLPWLGALLALPALVLRRRRG